MCGATPKRITFHCCRSTTRAIRASVAHLAPVCLSIRTIRVRAAGLEALGTRLNAAFIFRRHSGTSLWDFGAGDCMELLIGFFIAALIAMTGVGAGTISAPMLIL